MSALFRLCVCDRLGQPQTEHTAIIVGKVFSIGKHLPMLRFVFSEGSSFFSALHASTYLCVYSDRVRFVGRTHRGVLSVAK